MRKLLQLLLIFILFINCNDNGLNEVRYTVIEYERENMDWIFDEGQPTELKGEEIEKIENIIGERIENLISSREYYRQYVPIVNSLGEKHVWINFFCFEPLAIDGKWKTKPVFVLDGGDCFFGLKVNLTKETYYDFWMNGVAYEQPLPNIGYIPAGEG